MPLIPISGVAQATIKAKWNGVIDINTVWHVRRLNDALAEPFDAAALTQAANRVSGAWNSILASISSAWVGTEVVARDLSAADGAIVSLPIATVGGFAGAAQTGPYEGPVISWLTGTAGRNNGRTFVPGINEAVIDANGMINGTTTGPLKTAADAALAFLKAPTDATHVGVPLELVIVSAAVPLGQQGRAVRSIVGTRVRPGVGIQRRRRIGV